MLTLNIIEQYKQINIKVKIIKNYGKIVKNGL